MGIPKIQLHGAFPSKAGDSAYQVAQKNGFEGTEQEWLDSLVGPQGKTGESGPSGIHVGSEPPTDPTVHVWINPDSDDEFDELPAGPAGEDGGHYIPVVTQSESGKLQFDWSASREDMPTVASQSVTLPAGPKGETGETGPQGKTGADGKNAYQYAQDAGYTGTEEEFAEKLAADLPAGGSDSGKWMLDAEVKTTEQVTEITVDLHPIPRSIERCGCRIFIYVPFPTQGEEQQGINVYLNNQLAFGGEAVSNASNYSNFVAEIHGYGNAGNGWYSYHGAGLNGGIVFVDAITIQSDNRQLRVASKSGKLLPVGVKVRAEYYVMEDAV